MQYRLHAWERYAKGGRIHRRSDHHARRLCLLAYPDPLSVTRLRPPLVLDELLITRPEAPPILARVTRFVDSAGNLEKALQTRQVKKTINLSR